MKTKVNKYWNMRTIWLIEKTNKMDKKILIEHTHQLTLMTHWFNWKGVNYIWTGNFHSSNRREIVVHQENAKLYTSIVHT